MPEDAGIMEIGGLIALYGAFTAWRSSKNLADGLNSYNQNHQTPAQQQSGAQQGAQQSLSGSSAATGCLSCQPGCPPCKTASGKSVVPGTVAYRHDLVPPSKPHYPLPGDHYNLYQANQSPHPMCRCFWKSIGAQDASGGKPPPPGSIPIEPFV